MSEEIEVDADDEVPSKSAKPKPKKPGSSFPVGPLVALIAIGSLGWAVYEHQHAAELQTAVAQASAQVATLTQEVAAKDALVTSLNQQLNNLRQKSMPVAIVMRRANANSGLTAYFKNNAPVAMALSIVLSNPTTGRRREASMNIPPNEIRSIGEPEGWVFAPGHVIQMTQEQFGTAEYTVPVEDTGK